MNPSHHKLFVMLESLPPRAIKKWIKRHEAVLDYTAAHFSYFAHHRSKKMEELKQSIQENTIPCEFNNWCRTVSHQFSNTPLSAIGSIKSLPGGRFNIGQIDIARFPQFAALYLAEDTVTALLEMLGIHPEESIDGLSGRELAAAGNFSHFKIGGKLTNVLDLTNPQALQQFYTYISSIKLPAYFKNKARELQMFPMPPVKNLDELEKTIFANDWRLMPMQFDVPANSQILGQIAYSAGIEAIVYPSVKTGKKAMAIFPGNFNHSDAYIEIIGNVAETVTHTKIDKNSYQNSL